MYRIQIFSLVFSLGRYVNEYNSSYSVCQRDLLTISPLFYLLSALDRAACVCIQLFPSHCEPSNIVKHMHLKFKSPVFATCGIDTLFHFSWIQSSNGWEFASGISGCLCFAWKISDWWLSSLCDGVSFVGCLIQTEKTVTSCFSMFFCCVFYTVTPMT